MPSRWNGAKAKTRTWTCFTCGFNKNWWAKADCYQCGRSWSDDPSIYSGLSTQLSNTGAASSQPQHNGLKPVGLQGTAALFPPALVNAAASSGVGGSAGPAKQQESFVDSDGKVYQVQTLRDAHKYMAKVFGDQHTAVREIAGKLAEHDAKVAASVPFHILLGRTQKKLRTVEAKLLKVASDKDRAVKAHAEVVKRITELDRVAEALAMERHAIQAEIASLACPPIATAAPAIPVDVDAYGFAGCAEGIRAKATLLLQQLASLVQEVTIGRAQNAPGTCAAPAQAASQQQSGAAAEQTPTTVPASALQCLQGAVTGSASAAAAATALDPDSDEEGMGDDGEELGLSDLSFGGTVEDPYRMVPGRKRRAGHDRQAIPVAGSDGAQQLGNGLHTPVVVPPPNSEVAKALLSLGAISPQQLQQLAAAAVQGGAASQAQPPATCG